MRGQRATPSATTLGRGMGALLLAAAAGVAAAFPGGFELHRTAVEHGEVWRLWTGHLVHGSTAHFGYDVGAAVLLWVAFGAPRFWLWMAPLVSLVLLGVLPGLERYYGMSAILHAWVVIVALQVAAASQGARRLGAVAVAGGVLAKSATETWLGTSIFTSEIDLGGPVLHASHLVGATLGFVSWTVLWYAGPWHRPAPEALMCGDG